MGINDELIGYWKFDEDNGNTILDTSGNNNHGELINGSRSDGKSGKAINLKGRDNSHATIPESTTLNDFTDKITVTAWVFPPVTPDGFVAVVSRQVGTLLHPDQFYLGFGPEGGIIHYKWHLGTDDGTSDSLPEGDIYEGTPETDRWIHMAGTYDGSIMRLYIDGVEIGTQSLSGNIRVDDNPVTIGGEENGAEPKVVDGEFEGLIDEVRIYNRALSADEILEIFELHSD